MIPILLAFGFGEITHLEGGDSLIKIGTDVRRVQNLSWKQFPPKSNAWAKSAQEPNDWASFHDFWSAKLENFQQVGYFFHSFIKYYTFLVKSCQKPDA